MTGSQRAGIIVAQSPAGGTSLARGSRVRVDVSTGPNPAASAGIPDVVGQDQAAAASAVREAGFRVVVLFSPTKDQSRDGVVIEQQPVAGTRIPRNSRVALFVGSFGP